MDTFNGNAYNGDEAPLYDNPIRTFFDSYKRDTPMITRTIILLQAIAYIVNSFFDLRFGLGNIPIFVVFKFEVYRLLTSLFICTGFYSLILAYFSFVPTGKRLEYSMGSTEFACILLTIGLMTNVLYILFAFVFDGLLGSQYWQAIPSVGLWNVLFGVIAMECRKAPQHSVRKFLLWNIPTLHYPVALLILFSFFGGSSFAHWISMGLGYGFGCGYLDCFRISPSRFKLWEETYLQSLINQDTNFVVSSTAMGSGAWSNDATVKQEQDQDGLHGLFSRWSSPTQQQLPVTSDFTSNASKRPRAPSGGQQLGGESRIKNQDHRQMRLKAVERRIASNNNDV